VGGTLLAHSVIVIILAIASGEDGYDARRLESPQESMLPCSRTGDINGFGSGLMVSYVRDITNGVLITVQPLRNVQVGKPINLGLDC
jgi:hypothetical protein